MDQGVGAVVVTYNPDADWEERLRQVAAEVDLTVVVDNSEDAEVRERIRKVAERRRVVLSMERNIGIAAALNRGIACVADRGFHWVLTLDQDSTPSPGMVNALQLGLDKERGIGKIALIAPRIFDPGLPRHQWRWLARHSRFPLFFQRIPCAPNNEVIDVDMAISSGSLLNLEVFALIGPFREELFIDYVDTDYCLRAKAAGFRVVVNGGALLHHRLGSKNEVRKFGLTLRPTHHPALRHYYICRNRIFMYRRYAGVFPHWLLFDLSALCNNIFRVVACEESSGRKLASSLKGTWHGLTGKCGRFEE